MSKPATIKVTSEAYAGKSVRFAGTDVVFDERGVAQVMAHVAHIIAAYPGAFTIESAKPAKAKPATEEAA